MAPTWILIGLGGGAGAILRHALSSAVDKAIGTPAAAWGILVVNTVGCLGIGLLGGWAETRGLPEHWRYLLSIGLLGGFTTHSTFAAETLRLARHASLPLAFSYLALNVLLGLLAALAGHLLITRLTV